MKDVPKIGHPQNSSDLIGSLKSKLGPQRFETQTCCAELTGGDEKRAENGELKREY